MGSSLAGQVVVITGSTRGIGRAMAEACADAGATVVVSSRTSSAVEETVAAIRSRGAKASGVACDVAREADLEALLAHAVQSHGGVDVWVNNAGISLGMRYAEDATPEEIRRIVDVNLVGTMLASRMVVPHMVGRGGGVLINVSGRGGRGDAAPYTAAYAATKAGVTVFTRSLAGEHESDPISIQVFMPGMVDTDFYGEAMQVSPALKDLVGNVRTVLDCIGTPIGMVGPKLVAVATAGPAAPPGRIHSAGGGARRMLGGLRLMFARLSGRMKPMP